jgi:succinate-semialdehyde dehydrogenase/glutarate-semialdehyde dehydrogenase
MMTLEQKQKSLLTLKQALQSHEEILADLIHEEVKKPKNEAIGEVQKSILAIDYVLEVTAQLNWQEIFRLPSGYQLQLAPIGTVLAIEPWNFPMWQLFRVLPWNFWIGNRVLHKNSKYTQKLSNYLTPLIQQSLGTIYFESIYLPDAEVKELIESPRVQAVTLTGSTRAGKQVAASAGRALKKCVLELGGSDAFIIEAQASLKRLLQEAILARCQNSGQSCIAAKRFIVHKSHYKTFVQMLKEALVTYSEVNLVHPEALRQTFSQVELAISQGAKPIWPKGQGVLPLILEVAGTEPFLKSEEFFAPVFLVMPYENLEQSIQIANSTDYGLGASVWGANPSEKQIYSERLEAGFITFDEIVRSHPAVPFGGVKDSGFGREMGILGFLEFANIKIIKNL